MEVFLISSGGTCGLFYLFPYLLIVNSWWVNFFLNTKIIKKSKSIKRKYSCLVLSVERSVLGVHWKDKC